MVTRNKKPLLTMPSPPQRTPPPAPSRPRCRVLIIEARFYEDIADELARGAIEELESQGASWERIAVPGALEIPQVLAQAASSGVIPASAPSARFAGAVALGCVIRGETAHYDIVCNNANHWLMEIAIRNAIPVGNGILTVDNEKQAVERAKGGREGKGGDAVRACLRLVDTQRVLEGHGV
jgi:6,7-dimethyl-8-ribityllumazine synthase